MTEYKPIPNYDGYYAGTDGSIWSYRKHKKGIKLKQTANTNKHGHTVLQVNLYRGGEAVNQWGHVVKTVHKLILWAWVGMPEKGQECRHLNGNPTDNRLENLAWGTHDENTQDCLKHGTTTRGERDGMHKLTEAQVLEILRRVKKEKITKKMADGYCVYPSTIYRIKYGERWKHLSDKVKNSRVKK